MYNAYFKCLRIVWLLDYTFVSDWSIDLNIYYNFETIHFAKSTVS